MLCIGAITPVRAALLVLAQLVGSIVGAALISSLTPGPLFALTTLADGMSISRGCFLECFATFLLLLAVLFLAAEKHRATFLAPIGIGLALFVAELSTVFYTGGSLNPARSFGPAVVMGDFPVGPCLGALLAAAFFRFLKWMEYETVQDLAHSEATEVGGSGELRAPGMELLGAEGGKKKKREGKMRDLGEEEGEGRETQGPGIPDLLTGTAAAARGTYAAPTAPSTDPNSTSARLDRIEHLLLQLLPSHASHPSTSSGPSSASGGTGQFVLPSSPGAGGGMARRAGRASFEGGAASTLVEEREAEEGEVGGKGMGTGGAGGKAV
ncbi:hypothetical protein JCM8097_009064 [Rhodosporidiobolus ruineniae]